MTPESGQGLRGGELNAALTSALVGIHNDHMGRGPRSAYSFHHEDVVVTVMNNVLTKAERTLAETGAGLQVAQTRHLYQEAMRPDFTTAVERLTGRKVIAFVSGNNLDPDIAVEMFFLDEDPTAN